MAWVVPFAIGFEKIYVDPTQSQCLFNPDSHDGSLFATLRIIDVFIDLIFWTDIFINFVSARWVLLNEPIPHWEQVDDTGMR